jgi:hypothetical protein
MSLKRNVVKSCCGSSNIIITIDKPIRKSQMHVFREAEFFVPENFFQAGIFYIQNKQLIATASFGSNRINLRCTGSDCEAQISFFEILLEKAINS